MSENSNSSGISKDVTGSNPQPAPVKRRGRSSLETRELILRAALSEFAEQGYEGATTASIARRVGVTQPLVHYHFGSKEALWRTTVDGLFSLMLEHLVQMRASVINPDTASGLVELSYAFMDFAVEHPEFARIISHEGVVDSPRLKWMTDQYLRPMFNQWGEYLDALKAAGVVRNIPNAFILFAFFGAGQHFFDMAPLVRELYGMDARNEGISRAYTNSLLEILLTGATSAGEKH